MKKDIVYILLKISALCLFFDASSNAYKQDACGFGAFLLVTINKSARQSVFATKIARRFEHTQLLVFFFFIGV